MLKFTYHHFWTKINLAAAMLIATNFVSPTKLFAQTFEPTWDVIEISQGPHSDNLQASQIFTTGLYYYYAGNLDYAAVAFQTALSYDPNIALAHYLLGNSLYQLGRVDDAIIEYQKAISLDWSLAKAYNNLGTALSLQGNQEEAIANYEKALDFEPNLAIAMHNMGLALIQLRQYDQGIPMLENAKEAFMRAGDEDNARITAEYLACGINLSSSNRERAEICD
jgi:superkiller protein 3